MASLENSQILESSFLLLTVLPTIYLILLTFHYKYQDDHSTLSPTKYVSVAIFSTFCLENLSEIFSFVIYKSPFHITARHISTKLTATLRQDPISTVFVTSFLALIGSNFAVPYF